VQVAGGDLEAFGEFAAAPVAGWAAPRFPDS
jgi:hypothetical protein